ncbi:MAG: DUF624 domain-containing protein [Eubacteriales bacterium]|nr:DUF624 domain-containing protein [Eubacteriales bacterium]
MKFFSFDGPFARFMGRIYDLVLLHVLWVVCSLPIFTIGASTTALFTITLKMVRDEEPYILKGYIKAFRSNFVKATKLWMIVVMILVWLLFIMRICIKGKMGILKIAGIPNAALFFMVFLALLYLFPIQAVFENSVRNILKNSVICSMQYLPYSLLMAAILIMPILITGFWEPVFPFMITLWIFGGSSLIAFAESFVLNHVFTRITASEAAK